VFNQESIWDRSQFQSNLVKMDLVEEDVCAAFLRENESLIADIQLGIAAYEPSMISIGVVSLMTQARSMKLTKLDHLAESIYIALEELVNSEVLTDPEIIETIEHKLVHLFDVNAEAVGVIEDAVMPELPTNVKRLY